MTDPAANGRQALHPHTQLARTLADARRAGLKLTSYPEPAPASVDDAYAVQRLVTETLSWQPRGFKVGATSLRAQQILGIDRPFSARLFAERLFGSGDKVPTAPEHLRVVEPEVAFVMRDALGGHPQPYDAAAVLGAVESVHPALEIVSPRLPNALAQSLPWLIADGGINDAFVLGPGVAPLHASEYPALQIQASRNGVPVTQGVGANALGDPVAVLVWLANHLPALGFHLGAGDIVTTGLVTGIVECQWGDEVRADFAALGGVSVRF
jgi:2-keto-4-pentenoate hydratase